MGKKLAISLIIAALGSYSGAIMATDQSLHFRTAAPATAGAPGSPQQDDLRTAIKANGLPPIGSDSIDLIGSPADGPEIVTNKAARAQCRAAYSTSGVNCSVINTGTVTICAPNSIDCCEWFLTMTIDPISASCNRGAGTSGFQLTRLAQAPGDPNPEHPGRKVSATPTGGGSITHYAAENKNIYKDIGQDPAARTLIQVRPGGITGTITINIYHNQGGSNPRTATVNLTSANNLPPQSQALHNAIESALESISPALPVPIVATTRTRDDARPPLTAFGFLKQADHFTEVTNMQAAQILEVRVIPPDGVGVTVEGSDNVIDSFAGIPTLNAYGIVVLMAMLLMAGYLLKRRQRMGAATA